MNKQEIIEGNKLIMEFMGWRTTEVDDYGSSVSSTVEKTLVHRDWNLLMPVVEKIEGLYHNGLIFHIKDRRAYIEIDSQIAIVFGDEIPNIPDCYSGTSESKIQSAWKTVVSFIKFYNQQNNS